MTEKVRFVGRALPEELPDYFRLADIFVMPSTGEGFGISFLEAMASGIGVIGGNKDGSLDPLADGLLGLSIDPENDNELLSAICSALGNTSADATRSSRFQVQAFAEHLQALLRAGRSQVRRSPPRLTPNFGHNQVPT